MRIVRTAAIAISAIALASADAQAQSAPTCKQDAAALGVARTIEIDTTKGPRLGQQYKELELLADKEVVLTFDDGPSRLHTRAVLDALEAHCTKATFFMVGRMAVADPEMVQEVARRGHTVGTHTWSHAKLRALAPARAETEIELAISAVSRALGKPVAPFFRFPYLADSSSMLNRLRQRNIAIFSIDVDSIDYRTHDPNKMRQTVMGNLARQGKGILLFHDIQLSTARGIGSVLDELKAKGYRVVHLVPKDAVTTVASFDQVAAAEMARKSAAAGANPLARRSVVWPLANGSTPAPVAATAADPAVPGASGVLTPPGAGAAPVPAPAAANSPPALRGPAEFDWSQIFSR